MNDEVMKKMSELQNEIENAEYDINCAKYEFNNLWDMLKNNSERSIKDIETLKRELKRDNLYSLEMEEFLDNYMRFYNK